MHQLNGKGVDDSVENMSDITDSHQNYKKCEFSDECIKKENRKVKSKAEDF